MAGVLSYRNQSKLKQYTGRLLDTGISPDDISVSLYRWISENILFHPSHLKTEILENCTFIVRKKQENLVIFQIRVQNLFPQAPS